MPTRTLHIVRHGRADALGALTEEGRSQCRALGRRLADVPLDVIWHSPLPRAVDSAAVLAEGRRGLLVDEAPELVDAVPFVPDLDCRFRSKLAISGFLGQRVSDFLLFCQAGRMTLWADARCSSGTAPSLATRSRRRGRKHVPI